MHTPSERRRDAHLPTLGLSVGGYNTESRLYRMTGSTPDLCIYLSTFEPQSLANYTAWRNMDVNNLHKDAG